MIRVDGMESGSIRILGGRVKCVIAGPALGPTILLLHKLGGSVEEWGKLIPSLAKSYHVIAMDLPGHGGSLMDGDPPFIITHELLAAIVMYALGVLGVQQPVWIVGSSVGASVGVTCAANSPSKVRGLVSLGASFGESTSVADLEVKAREAIANGDYDSNELPITRPLDALMKNFGIHDTQVAASFNQSRALAGKWVAPTARGVSHCDLLGILERVPVPVCLAYGIRGQYKPYAETAMTRVRHGSVVAVPDCGAFPHEEAPTATLEVIHRALENGMR